MILLFLKKRKIIRDAKQVAKVEDQYRKGIITENVIIKYDI